ncbi:hypothetical protein LTR37_004736 [Vermiconidia calcicola]|uniref:Uncharacterized protein n=1 Tax=Vermiconidia calcicola TaxID=1690605 RepID=A0ACC3NNR9_9PEZI|nr:hypothetical protein LTR37_004736 [Vermiconidia calcicola]
MNQITRYQHDTRIVEERRPPPPSVHLEPLPHLPTPPPPPSAHHSVRRVESRRTSHAPSVHRSHYVEVEQDTSSSSSSSSSSSDDMRSRTTHKTAKTRKSSNTHRSSKSKATAPASEYSVHEKELRRERAYSRPKEEYETYRYVNAPPDVSRSRSRRDYHDDPRASRGSYARDTRIMIEDDHGRRQIEYRR